MDKKTRTIITKELKNKTVLITGGAGSVGSILVKKILEFPVKTVRVLDIDEHALFRLKRSVNDPRLRLLLGSITDKERMESLFKANTITRKQYEDANARFDIAQAQLNSAKENFNKIKNIARPEEIAQARANYQKAEAVVESINKNIRDCYVVSPMNGFVIKKFIELGETVSMLSSLFKLADLSKAKVTIYVSETEIGKIKLRQKAEIKVDSFPDKSFEGKVIYISPEAEFTPKNIQTKDERTKLVFAVKIEIPNPQQELKTGLPADVKIIL